MDNDILDHISQALLYLIHIVPRLKFLFQRWCVMDENYRNCIDYEMLHVGFSEKHLYKSLRKAFIIWEHVQDTEGAPGFQPEANEYRLEIELQDRITRMLNEFEMILSKLETHQSINMIYDDRYQNYKTQSNINVKRNASHILMEMDNGDENKLERRKSF